MHEKALVPVSLTPPEQARRPQFVYPEWVRHPHLLLPYLLLPFLLLSSCAPRPSVAAPTRETQVYEGSGSGTLTSARYRLAISLDKAGDSALGIFYNLSAGNNYAVRGTYVPTGAGADLDLELSSEAGAALSGTASLGKTLPLGLSGSFKVSAQLTGRVVGDVFQGRLRTVTANYEVKLKRVE